MFPCASRLGSLAKPYLRWSLQGPGAFTIAILGRGFLLYHVGREICVLCSVIMSFSQLDELCKGLEEVPGKLALESVSL
jgi:hypothetical protein